jgi:hypothetical protein
MTSCWLVRMSELDGSVVMGCARCKTALAMDAECADICERIEQPKCALCGATADYRIARAAFDAWNAQGCYHQFGVCSGRLFQERWESLECRS